MSNSPKGRKVRGKTIDPLKPRMAGIRAKIAAQRKHEGDIYFDLRMQMLDRQRTVSYAHLCTHK